MTPDEIKPGVRRSFELEVHRPDSADGLAELLAIADEEVRWRVSRGEEVAAARAQVYARLGFPGVAALVAGSAQQRESRMKLQDWLADLRHDIGYAFRTLRRAPALATAAILTLALAIGANTAIFSAVSAVLLRPLPFGEPDRLVALWEENPDFHWYQQDAAPANMLDWKEQAGVFDGVAGYQSFNGTITLTGRGEPRMLKSQIVTGDLFRVLGVRPAYGAGLREADTWADAPRRAMLSWQAWRDGFGADPGVIGQTVTLNGRQVEIVGVLPKRFRFPGLDGDIWMPMRWDKANRAQVFFRRAHFVRVVARLKPGVKLEGANAALQTVVGRLKREYPVTNVHMGAGLTPLHEFLVGKTKLPLLVMLGGVGLLLLIACANVANLLLVRAAGRERESALRLALGASRGRLFRHALVENAVLALLGGVAGVGIGIWGTRVLAALQPAGMLPVHEVSVSVRVLLYALGVTLLAALVFGIAPTLWTMRRDAADVLRDEGRTASSTLRVRRWGEALLVCQVALALALMLGAGLLVRSYLLLQRVEPGFDPSNVLTVELNLPGIRYDSTRKVLAFYDALQRGARALPGVQAVAVTSGVPLGPPTWSSEFSVEGRPPMERGGEVLHRELGGDYLKVMRVPLLKGRFFSESDRADQPNVVLINQALAEKWFKGEDPIGRRIAFDRVPDSTSFWRTIVGVVGSEHQRELAEPARPEFIAPYSQDTRSGLDLLLRSSGDPAALGPQVRALVSRIDPLLAISSMVTMTEVKARSLARDRFLTVLMLAFAGVGMLLGVVGVYGVMAQLTRRRMREMGIRIALGAKARQVQWLVVRHGAVLTGLGIGAGMVLAAGATRVIESLLYQVTPLDAVTFILVPLLVLVTALLAAWIPALRASRTDVTAVLRVE
jgi:putative ABC transport system permease protein